MKRAFLLGMAWILAGCGGSPPTPKPVAVMRATPVAFGPISKACLQSDRKGRSRELCGCIQAVADRTLSRAQQRRSVVFYTDPHLAQVIRQSDRAADEEFWEAYVAYGEQAERICG